MRERANVASVGVALLTVVAIGAVGLAVFLLSEGNGPSQQARAAGATDMSLSSANCIGGTVTTVNGASGTAPAKPVCNVTGGSTFTVSFNVVKAAVAYGGYDLGVTWSGNVNYNLGSLSQPASVGTSCGPPQNVACFYDDFPVGDAASSGTPKPAATGQLGNGSMNTASAQNRALNSTFTGSLATMSFVCKDSGAGTITLVGGSGNTDLATDTGPQFEAANESLAITCVPPTATPTLTLTPTPTNTPNASPTPTPNPDPRMRLDTTGGVTCVDDLTVAGNRRCDAKLFAGSEKRGEFTLQVTAFHDVSQVSYGGFKTQIDFDDGLTYNARSCGVEVVWDQGEVTCGNPVVAKSVRHNVRTSAGPPFTATTFVGTIVAVKAHCAKPGDHQITLKVPGGSNPGTAYISTTNTEIPVAVDNSPDIDVITVRCQAQPPEMSLRASAPGVTCIAAPTPSKPDKCVVPFLSVATGTPQPPFTISVRANVIPANATPALDGYGGFDSEVLFGGLKYALPKPSCLVEAIWPDVLLCAQNPPLTVGAFKQHQLRSGLFAPFPASHYTGDLLRMSAACPNLGQFQVVLPAFSSTAPLNGGAQFRRPDDTTVALATVVSQSLDLNGDTVAETAAFGIADALLINCEIVPPTSTPTSTATPTSTPCPTVCPTATSTFTATPTATQTSPPTNTPTLPPTNTPTLPPTNTPTITPTPTPCCERINQELLGPGKVSTDTEHDGATGTDQVETSVSTTRAGKVTIDEADITEPEPTGYDFFGQQVDISAPNALLASNPLVIQFTLDTSIIPSGQNQNTLQVFRNGSQIPNCTGAPGSASPDPCVSKRNLLVGPAAGDILFTILTTDASTWNFGFPTGAAGLLGDVNCNGEIDPVDAQFILQFVAAIIHALPCPQNADVNHSGSSTPTDSLLILQLDAGLIDGFPAGAPGGDGVWSGTNALLRLLGF